jgi:hypothetical protein
MSIFFSISAKRQKDDDNQQLTASVFRFNAVLLMRVPIIPISLFLSIDNEEKQALNDVYYIVSNNPIYQ